MENKHDNIEIISSFEMEDLIEQQPENNITVYSNIPSLDRAIEGFTAGELIVISGLTKNGKTLLAQTLTSEFVKQNYFPLWFTYEVMPKEFLKQFPKLPLFYMPKKLESNAMDWLEKCIQLSFEKYHTRIIFIDHLHYLFDIARTNNPSIEIGTVVRRLKLITVNKGMIIFLLCHTKKGATNDKITYDSIRDSSFVSQESDSVFLIARNSKDAENCEAKLKVEFHRRTGIWNKSIKLKKIDGYLREVETKCSR